MIYVRFPSMMQWPLRSRLAVLIEGRSGRATPGTNKRCMQHRVDQAGRLLHRLHKAH